MTYKIGVNGDGSVWIQCATCGMRSYNANDIQNKYCGNCHVFHKDQAAWTQATSENG